jgi:asparaginyl-tRNA synthetase
LAVENYACALTNVYTFGPTFRAENSHTSRHLAEFWMIEPEICFAQLPELFVLIESYMKYCIDYCLKNIPDDMDYFEDLYQKSNKGKSE